MRSPTWREVDFLIFRGAVHGRDHHSNFDWGGSCAALSKEPPPVDAWTMPKGAASRSAASG